ncbi:SRPBCC family protein [Marinilongibacter aquaticus]|uniref:SRPBCC family protein n=1 Tax=Marinilongibacter aquaticus TaxID=2975157 RepID=UPI0021BD3AD1|nr:SRPBCC family protein [Marinilongibacter aquaticus]UBM59703.1 SRPBCC family protein [Marinilongibacter aquaticus]
METTKVSIEAHILADAQKVWAYYTEPEHITQWNFADPSWHCPQAENDLRVGGKYKARMEAKDGSFGFDFEALYDEVEEGKKIVYTMGDGRNCTVSFESTDEGTKVTTVFDAENQNPIEMQKNGWQAILNNFKSYTETH